MAASITKTENGYIKRVTVGDTVLLPGAIPVTSLETSQEAVSVNDHKNLQHFVHLSDGISPGYLGHASPYLETSYAPGTPFVSEEVWYTQLGGNRLLSKSYTRDSNQSATLVVWRLYDGTSPGPTPPTVAAMSETISYNGVLEVSRTRSLS